MFKQQFCLSHIYSLSCWDNNNYAETTILFIVYYVCNWENITTALKWQTYWFIMTCIELVGVAHSHKNIHKLGLCSGWWDIFGGRNLRNQSAESPPSDAISEHIRLSRVPPFLFVVTLYTTHSIAHLVNVNVLVLKVIQISNSYPRWQVSTLHILSNSVLVYPGVPMSIMVMSALAVVGTPLHGVNTPPRRCVHWSTSCCPYLQ